METELNHTALYSHDMNIDTKSLVQTLQFLQSPLAVRQPKEKLNSLLHQAEDVAVRLNQSFEMNRDRSSLIMKSIRGEYERSPIDIVKCVRASTSKYFLLAEKKKIELKTRIPDNSVTVEGNPTDLIRVVDNLLNNALRYVDAGGHIEVSCGADAGAFEIVVKDDGQGIEPSDIERIWLQGWQAKDARQGASGFGLSIARQIVHLHQGRIHVESEGRGKGTLFRILIPLIDSHPKAETHSDVKAEKPS
jgi:signal transduction histidine kinase